MKLHFDPLVGDTLARLSGVKALIEHSDRSIPEMEFRARKELKALAEANDWEYGDYDVARQELEACYRHWVPKYAGYSAVVLLCSVAETQLVSCAERLSKERASAFRVRDMKDGAITYIKRVADVDPTDDPAWPYIRDMQKLRNIIVHRGGSRGEVPEHQKEFDELVSRYGNKVSVVEGLWMGKELWISIQLTKDFAQEIELFFKRIFNRLGLPENGITHCI